MRVSGKALLVLVLQHKERKQETDALASSQKGAAWILKWGNNRGRIYGLGRRCSLGGLSTPLVVPRARIMCSALLLLLAPQKWRCVVAFLYPIAHNCPNLCMHAVIFSQLQFLCIPLLKEPFVQVQALPGPSLPCLEEDIVGAQKIFIKCTEYCIRVFQKIYFNKIAIFSSRLFVFEYMFVDVLEILEYHLFIRACKWFCLQS